MMSNHLCGWIDDQDEVEAILADDSPVWDDPGLVDRVLEVSKTADQMTTDKESVVLFDALQPLAPNWTRGAQKIGSCVAWGAAMAVEFLIAVEIHQGAPWVWQARCNTESIYGGSRCEIGGWWGRRSDGSIGGYAAKWLTNYGVLLRLDYSAITGNSSTDMRQYNPRKEKDWGAQGNGGKGRSEDAFDRVAKESPIKNAHLVTNFEQAAAAIESGYPITVASGVGLSQRDSNGEAHHRGSWAHQMCFGGVRFDRPALLCVNSWGNSWGTSAPLPGVEWDEAKKCSAWVPAKVVNRMLGQRDSYILSGASGLKRREIDFKKGWEI